MKTLTSLVTSVFMYMVEPVHRSVCPDTVPLGIGMIRDELVYHPEKNRSNPISETGLVVVPGTITSLGSSLPVAIPIQNYWDIPKNISFFLIWRMCCITPSPSTYISSTLMNLRWSLFSPSTYVIPSCNFEGFVISRKIS